MCCADLMGSERCAAIGAGGSACALPHGRHSSTPSAASNDAIQRSSALQPAPRTPASDSPSLCALLPPPPLPAPRPQGAVLPPAAAAGRTAARRPPAPAPASGKAVCHSSGLRQVRCVRKEPLNGSDLNLSEVEAAGTPSADVSAEPGPHPGHACIRLPVSVCRPPQRLTAARPGSTAGGRPAAPSGVVNCTRHQLSK